ncbi:MAG: aminomethyl-transferring glycine dehydrogenase subunit GcvPB, partial [candidate division Zixibacteria bacterium]|nr:aminomethyl-transferring glycine dehydrogenase subunit GcvPB [candidate division Zixibacteria bacterium]
MDERVLVYEKSRSGRTGYTLPATEKSEDEILAAIPTTYRRDKDAALPEITEAQAMRHFVNLSTKNHHIEKGFYPLGSCTMKYNPKMNDVAANMPGFRDHHPSAPCATSAGSLRLMWELEECLKEVSGFGAVTLQPLAGAQGELAGLLIMRKYHEERGQKRTKIIIPNSAHGTNPASVTAVGYTTVQVQCNADGVIEPEDVAA